MFVFILFLIFYLWESGFSILLLLFTCQSFQDVWKTWYRCCYRMNQNLRVHCSDIWLMSVDDLYPMELDRPLSGRTVISRRVIRKGSIHAIGPRPVLRGYHAVSSLASSWINLVKVFFLLFFKWRFSVYSCITCHIKFFYKL